MILKLKSKSKEPLLFLLKNSEITLPSLEDIMSKLLEHLLDGKLPLNKDSLISIANWMIKISNLPGIPWDPNSKLPLLTRPYKERLRLSKTKSNLFRIPLRPRLKKPSMKKVSVLKTLTLLRKLENLTITSKISSLRLEISRKPLLIKLTLFLINPMKTLSISPF